MWHSLHPLASFMGTLNKIVTLTEGLTGDVYAEVVFFFRVRTILPLASQRIGTLLKGGILTLVSVG